MSKIFTIRMTAYVLAISTALTISSNAFAETVMRFDFGSTSTSGDLLFSAGVFGTIDDGDASTTGDQTSSVLSDGFFNALFTDIAAGGSITLENVVAFDPPAMIGVDIFQQTTGGMFFVYDSGNPDSLLLSGNLGAGLISGADNSDTAGFSVQSATFTGGSLLGNVDPNSGTFSLTMTNVQTNGMDGLDISGGSLVSFRADATGQIEAAVVPEPSGVFIAAILVLGLVHRRSKRRK